MEEKQRGHPNRERAKKLPSPLFPSPVYLLFTTRRFHYEADSGSSLAVRSDVRHYEARSGGQSDQPIRLCIVSILCAARILPDLRLFESLNRTTRNTESRQQTHRASSKFSGRFFPPREKSLEKALERSHEERDKEGEGEKAGKIPGYAPFLFARPVRIIFLANFSPPLLPPFFLLSSRYRLSPRATSTKKERKEKEKRRGERKGEIAN